jgi:hexosaminidase
MPINPDMHLWRIFPFMNKNPVMLLNLCAWIMPMAMIQAQVIIPLPRAMAPGPGHFELTPETVLVVPDDDPATGAVAAYFAGLIRPATGLDLALAHAAGTACHISFRIDPQIDGPSGAYALSVRPERILITAPEPVGLFYGVQSLRQLLPPEINAPGPVQGVAWTVPSVEIADAPRFPHRGLLLDVGRHMFPVATIKKQLDLMALLKLNVFHWHLTEDQGWRLESVRYPELAATASMRPETMLGHKRFPGPRRFDGTPYGGYYTRDEVREVVAYAHARHISVIPEIEMPGHTLAVLAAYPELGCTGGPYTVATTWDIFADVFCAGNDAVFTFLENILLEVMELFPGEYIHIGGDECPKARWRACAKCQQRIADEGLADEHELQSYFIRRIEAFLQAHGRRLIGWDEILEGGLAPNATVMSWRGVEGGIQAARMGHDVVMTPRTHLYFDYYQDDPAREPLANDRLLPLDLVYAYDPLSEGLTEAQARHILGAQGCLWTEYIRTPDYLEYMAWPRGVALAEVVWSPQEARDYDDFKERLRAFLQILDVLQVNYRDPLCRRF